MSALEQHFSPKQLADLWGLNPKTVREIFKDEPGVIAVGEGTRKQGRGFVRRYFTLRIPESVAIRVHDRLKGKARVQ